MFYNLLLFTLVSFVPSDTSFTIEGFSPTKMHTACFEGNLYLEITNRVGLSNNQINDNTIRRWQKSDVQRKEINLTINFYDIKFFFTEHIENGKKVIEFPPKYTIDISNITKVRFNRQSLDLTIDHEEHIYTLNFYYSQSVMLQSLYECFKRLQPTYKFKLTVEDYLLKKKIIH